VKWEDSTTEQFGRVGQTFNGHVDDQGEPTPHRGDGEDEPWGDKNEPGIQIATDDAKARIAEQHAERKKREEERETELARLIADPAYQKRQAHLARYTELLKGIGHAENGWNNQQDFRIELDGIKPDQMERVISAIGESLKGAK
jgi:hypothetical protein